MRIQSFSVLCWSLCLVLRRFTLFQAVLSRLATCNKWSSDVGFQNQAFSLSIRLFGKDWRSG